MITASLSALSAYGFLPTMIGMACWLSIVTPQSGAIAAEIPSALRDLSRTLPACSNSGILLDGIAIITLIAPPTSPIFGLLGTVYVRPIGPPGGFQSSHFHPPASNASPICRSKPMASGSPLITANEKLAFWTSFIDDAILACCS
jgi:hypothetical protein